MDNLMHETKAVVRGIAEDTFYGPKSPNQIEIETILSNTHDLALNKCPPKFMRQLLGPSRTWKVFKKQCEAQHFCSERKNELMCFAFEQRDGQRSFLVAHPKTFWAVNCDRFFRDCSTYEVIHECETCKLYLDIEFEYEHNSKALCGNKMINNFITILNHNLYSIYEINCTENDILDLDSSNTRKFSHHIIYQIPNTAFRDNYAVGNFVCGICNELKAAFDSYVNGNSDKLIKLAEKYKLTKEDILEFFIKDCKGKVKLFIDEGVYTKNRHFRLLGSTKLGKNSPLRVSESNKYAPKQADKSGCSIFLDSLITYFSVPLNKILDCASFNKNSHGKQREVVLNTSKCQSTTSEFFEVDTFIEKLIYPHGRIRRKSYIPTCSKIIYDIFGYRYCNNIKRHHKSNNIMFIVNLENQTYYQKCHDPDCSDFKSDPVKLPDEICFLLEDDSSFMNCDMEAGDNLDHFDDEVDEDIVHNVEALNEILDCREDILNDAGFQC